MALIKAKFIFGNKDEIEGYISEEELTLFQCGLTDTLVFYDEEEIQKRTSGVQLTLENLTVVE